MRLRKKNNSCKLFSMGERKSDQKKQLFKGLTPNKAGRCGLSEKLINVLNIYTMIAQKRYPSVNQLADNFNVSRRTVYRYLEMIGDVDQIELDKERNGYKFTHGDRIKKLQLSEDEFLLLLAFGSAVSHLGSPLRDNFKKFTEKMVNIATPPSPKGTAPIMIRIPDAIEDENFDHYFKTISICAEERRSIDIVYTTRDSKEVNERRVDPYGLVFHDGSWILIGYCHLRKDMRHFALDRISQLKGTNLYFKVKDDFDLEKSLSHSWGVYAEKEVRVTVRFARDVADLITRKKRWHPSEERKILPDGDVELSFTVAGAHEIKKWIYTWLPYAEVVKPKRFRERVNKELSVSAKKHL